MRWMPPSPRARDGRHRTEMSGHRRCGRRGCKRAGKAVEAFDFGGVSPSRLNPADYPVVPGGASEMFGWPNVLENRNLRGACVRRGAQRTGGPRGAPRAYGRMRGTSCSARNRGGAQGLWVDWYATICIAGAFADLMPIRLAGVVPAEGRAAHATLPELGKVARIPQPAPRENA